MTVVVVYASRHGATAEIAARIAARLADSATPVELLHVDEVETLEAYDAVVFGAPVCEQAWPPEANRFVDEKRHALAARPLWLFNVGAFGDTKRLIGPLTHKEPKGIARLVRTFAPATTACSRASSASISGRSGRACSSTRLAGASAIIGIGRR